MSIENQLPRQSSNWGAEARTKSKPPPPFLFAIPVFDSKAGFNNRHFNSNRGICYANDFEVRLRVLTDLAKD